MWKAFDEMEKLGWIGPERPRMVCVQAEGCAPVVKGVGNLCRSFRSVGKRLYPGGGLTCSKTLRRLPDPRHHGSKKGTAVSADDSEIMEAVRHWARVEGVFAAPEGAASLVAYRKLRQAGSLARKTRSCFSTPAQA